jgi:hypothetical protein
VLALQQYVSLWARLQDVQLQVNSPGQFLWRWTSHQWFSSASAYRAFFVGQSSIPGVSLLRKTRAPPSCKFFLWLALLDHCWASERLQRHNLENSGPCVFCSQEVETIHHLLLGCSYSREVWYRLLRPRGLQVLTPTAQASLPDWWATHIPKAGRKYFDTSVALICWLLWKERNARVFLSRLQTVC